MMSKKEKWLRGDALVPLAILIIFGVVFILLVSRMETKDAIESVKLIVNKAIPYIVAGLGTLFVTAMGGTDITHGALIAFEFSVVVMVGNALGGPVGIIVGILCGLVSGFLLGFINSKFKVPSFMVSLGLLVFFRALSTMIGGTAYIDLPEFVTVFGKYYISIPITVVLFIFMRFLFHNTPFGYYVRAIGENENAVKFSGIDVDKIKIYAFIISGVMIAIAGILNMGTKSTLLPSTTGLGFEMSVLIAMFIGGIPVRGGFGCKMYMIIIGAFTVAIMENVLGSLLLFETYYVQLIKGIMLIAILFLAAVFKRRTTVDTAADM